VTKSYAEDFTAGTGNNQVNTVFHDTRTLAGGASEELDLAGSLTNALGATVTFTYIKALMIFNKSATQTLTIGGAATNAWEAWTLAAGDAIKILPDGMLLLVAPLAGYAVTASTADKLKILNSATNSADYDIWIIGI
jgi:hypothetical protein